MHVGVGDAGAQKQQSQSNGQNGVPIICQVVNVAPSTSTGFGSEISLTSCLWIDAQLCFFVDEKPFFGFPS